MSRVVNVDNVVVGVDCVRFEVELARGTEDASGNLASEMRLAEVWGVADGKVVYRLATKSRLIGRGFIDSMTFE